MQQFPWDHPEARTPGRRELRAAGAIIGVILLSLLTVFFAPDCRSNVRVPEAAAVSLAGPLYLRISSPAAFDTLTWYYQKIQWELARALPDTALIVGVTSEFCLTWNEPAERGAWSVEVVFTYTLGANPTRYRKSGIEAWEDRISDRERDKRDFEQ